MKRVAIYARVSSDDQAERGTIENQLEFARKYCDLHQLNVVKWYKDDGVTGTIPLEDREDGAKVLQDAKDKMYDLILIYRLDRLGRSARIILNAVHELEGYGVKIRSMTEPFDTSDPSGRFMLTMLAGVADLERETILERMWHGANRAARAGKWLGGIVPYGYRVGDEGYLEINEDPLPGLELSESDVVRLIYRLISEQEYSTIKVADYLNALIVPPSYVKDNRQITIGKRKVKTAGFWRPGRIRNMVVNTTYMGIHEYGKRTNKKRDTIKREVPAIITEEVWERAQLVLRENQIESTKNAKEQYLLRSLIKCDSCGMTYHGTTYRENQAYYICGGKSSYRGPHQERCQSKNLSREWVEDLIWKDCITFIENPGEAIKELMKNVESKKLIKESMTYEKKTIQQAIQDKEFEKQSILDLFRRRIINNRDVEEQLQKISREKITLEERIKDLEREIEHEDQLERQFTSIEEMLLRLREKITDNPTFEVRREIVKTLVKQIKAETITEEGKRPRVSLSVEYSFVKVVP